jgi:hypothetical protein
MDRKIKTKNPDKLKQELDDWYSRPIPIPTNQTDHKQVIDDFLINPQETLIIVQGELVSPTRQALLNERRPTREASFENKSRGIETLYFHIIAKGLAGTLETKHDPVLMHPPT